MAPPTLNTAKTLPTIIILPSLANEPDARVKGTEPFRDQQKLTFSAVRTSRVGSHSFNSESNCELDSHADTCVLGKHAHIFMDHGKSVNIVGYEKSKGTLASNMKTVSGVLAYDSSRTGRTVIIVIHQAIHVPTIDCNMICPMQVRMNDVKLDDKPKFLT